MLIFEKRFWVPVSGGFIKIQVTYIVGSRQNMKVILRWTDFQEFSGRQTTLSVKVISSDIFNNHPPYSSKKTYKKKPNPKPNPNVFPLNIFLGRNDLILAKSLLYHLYYNTHSLLLAAITIFSQDKRTAQTNK